MVVFTWVLKAVLAGPMTEAAVVEDQHYQGTFLGMWWTGAGNTHWGWGRRVGEV